MKVLFACGSHPRHAYIARKLYDTGLLSGLIIEDRHNHVPPPPSDISEHLKDLFQHHFNIRNKSELAFFGETEFPQVTSCHIQADELNGAKVHHMIQSIEPDLFISYGVHMIHPMTLSLLKGEMWNIHGGLSPWYRGCITHFWPSYFLEPQMTGMTIHQLTDALDAGPVVHQNAAPMIRGDGLHDVACRAVKGCADELHSLVSLVQNKGTIEKHEHTTSGRIWRAKDWQPAHLSLIYDTYNDQIVDRYLDGDFDIKQPKLVRQFN